ncbi:MAG: ANTAR domain-containing protein [Eubacteriales bacterium]|nr:ANTAR domain-containing protein [Eubacteriales bacterium]
MVSIIVVFPKAEDARNIRNILVRNGYQVSAVCTSGAQVLQAADDLGEGIVVCGYKYADMMYTQLKEYLPAGFEMLLIASGHVLEMCPDREIVRLALPLKVHDMVNTLEMMYSNMARRRRRERNKPKVRTEEEKQLIADAKKLLMERNHMTEEEAHRYMQKCSMDSGTNLVETAQIVFTLMKY